MRCNIFDLEVKTGNFRYRTDLVGGFIIVTVERESVGGAFQCICGKRTAFDRSDFRTHCKDKCRFYLASDGLANESKQEEREDDEEEASRTLDEAPSVLASDHDVEEMIKTGGIVVHHSTQLESPDAHTVLCTACNLVLTVSDSLIHPSRTYTDYFRTNSPRSLT
jgi:hypothetical protein